MEIRSIAYWIKQILCISVLVTLIYIISLRNTTDLYNRFYYVQNLILSFDYINNLKIEINSTTMFFNSYETNKLKYLLNPFQDYSIPFLRNIGEIEVHDRIAIIHYYKNEYLIFTASIVIPYLKFLQEFSQQSFLTSYGRALFLIDEIGAIGTLSQNYLDFKQLLSIAKTSHVK